MLPCVVTTASAAIAPQTDLQKSPNVRPRASWNGFTPEEQTRFVWHNAAPCKHSHSPAVFLTFRWGGRRKEYCKTGTEARLMRHIHADGPPVALSDASFTSASPSAYVMKPTFNSAEVARSTFSFSVRWKRRAFPFPADS